MTAARENLGDLPGVEIVAARVETALARRRITGPVDLVVLDPPRTGAGAAVVRAVTAAGPRAVAYVACDPAAFARDVRTFGEQGWRLAALRGFDLLPDDPARGAGWPAHPGLTRCGCVLTGHSGLTRCGCALAGQPGLSRSRSRIQPIRSNSSGSRGRARSPTRSSARSWPAARCPLGPATAGAGPGPGGPARPAGVRGVVMTGACLEGGAVGGLGVTG